MKLTGIAIGPSGFVGVIPIPEEPPPPPPPPTPDGALYLTHFTEAGGSKLRRIDPSTGTTLAVYSSEFGPFNLGYPDIEGYLDVKLIDGLPKVFLRWRGFGPSSPPPDSPFGDCWQILSFSDLELTFPIAVSMANYSGAGNADWSVQSYAKSLMQTEGTKVFVTRAARNAAPPAGDAIVNSLLPSNWQMSNAGYNPDDGTLYVEHDVGDTLNRNRFWCFAPDASVYTINDSDLNIYHGTLDDRYNSLFYSIFAMGAPEYLCVDKETGHLFISFYDNASVYKILELDSSGTVLNTYIPSTTSFAINYSNSFGGPIASRNGKLYAAPYLEKAGDSSIQICDGVWVIDILGVGTDLFHLEDSSGNGNTIINSSGIESQPSLIPGGDGSILKAPFGGYIGSYTSPSDLSVLDNSWWICGWVDSIDDYGTLVRFDMPGGFSIATFGFQPNLPADDHILIMVRNYDGSGGGIDLKYVGVVSTPGPHFIFGSYNSITDTFKLYMDGVLLSTQSGSGNAMAVQPNSVNVGASGTIPKTYQAIAYGTGVISDAEVSDLYSASSDYATYVAAQMAMGPFGYYYLNSRVVHDGETDPAWSLGESTGPNYFNLISGFDVGGA